VARKFTYIRVKQIFKAAGFGLLSNSYRNSKQPLAYRCTRCGYEGATRLECVKAGNRCPNCWEARRGQSHKHSLDFVREKFADKGLELLDKCYPESKTPLSYRCTECGYEGRLRFNDLSNGSGCRQCGIRQRTTLRKLDFEAFKKDLQERGIEVLSREYVNSGTKLKLRCFKCRRLWRARANDLLNTTEGCPRCGHKRGGRKLAYTHEQVLRVLAKRGISLQSHYERSQKSIRVRFNRCGHFVWRTWNEIQRGVGCPKCASNARPTRRDYRVLAAKFGGQVLEIAQTSNHPSEWRCSHGHSFRRPLVSIKGLGTFCTVCSGSHAEMLCRAAVEKLFGKPFQSRRMRGMPSPSGHPLQLDIYNEDLRIAVEHHGAQHYRSLPHWHGSEGLKRQRRHDLLRRKFCKEKGILLVEIRELGNRTSLEEMRQQIRDALLRAGRNIPSGFEATDLTNLPHSSASQVYWAEVHEAAEKMGLKILSVIFQGAEVPITVRCKQGHITPKTPRSILGGNNCDECYMEQMKRPLRLSDGRVFESGAAAAKVLGVRKDTVNTAIRKNWSVKGFRLERISWTELRRLSQRAS